MPVNPSHNPSQDSGPEPPQDRPIEPSPGGPLLPPQQAAERQRRLLLRIIRVAFLVLFMMIPLLAILGSAEDPQSLTPGQRALRESWAVVLGVTVALGAVVVLVDVFTPRKKISTLFSVFLGLLGAMVASLAVGVVIDLIGESFDITPSITALVKVLAGTGLAYLTVATVLQTQDDFRLVIPYVEFAKQVRGPRPLILDTSALVDGRIAELAQTGIIHAPVVVPKFVLAELQRLADSQDKLKRSRGRRGLSIVGRLQRTRLLDVSIDDRTVSATGVDQMLVELARAMQAMIVTTDAGLSQVAQIQNVGVMNLHDVANAMKPSLLVGEPLTLRLVRPGEQPGQAVGYLDDGTMVVVDQGAGLIGTNASLTVTSSIQTSAGRMIFAKPAGEAPAVVVADPSARVEDGGEAGETPRVEREPPADESEPPAPPLVPPPVAPDQTPKPGPFPVKPPRTIRGASPRNPRR